jgi:DNA-binding LacI/PurR family transcriptional regulator
MDDQAKGGVQRRDMKLRSIAESEAWTGESSGTPKYKQIYTQLRRAIGENVYAPGSKLPSESELVEHFSASRPTVGRALAQLESEGLVQRRAGSGSFVTERAEPKHLAFGLLIPELGLTEIFEPICHGISHAGPGASHDLIWGPVFQRNSAVEVQAEQLCEYYLKRNLAGVFFAPMELSDGKDLINQRIARAFDDAGVPIVLLDRDICEYPRRSRYDLVGIDNRRAGRVITDHLLEQGARRIAFFWRPNSAPTVKQRALGYEEALHRWEGYDQPPQVISADPEDLEAVRRFIEEHAPDAIVCANDYTAAHLMTTLDQLGVQVPSEIRITGVDDVKYSSLLKVPLTTVKQPCEALGSMALLAMTDRVAHPSLPGRDFLIDFSLVVRASSGSRPA